MEKTITTDEIEHPSVQVEDYPLLPPAPLADEPEHFPGLR